MRRLAQSESLRTSLMSEYIINLRYVHKYSKVWKRIKMARPLSRAESLGDVHRFGVGSIPIRTSPSLQMPPPS